MKKILLLIGSIASLSLLTGCSENKTSTTDDKILTCISSKKDEFEGAYVTESIKMVYDTTGYNMKEYYVIYDIDYSKGTEDDEFYSDESKEACYSNDDGDYLETIIDCDIKNDKENKRIIVNAKQNMDFYEENSKEESFPFKKNRFIEEYKKYFEEESNNTVTCTIENN